MAAMSIYKVLREAERFGVSFRVCNSKDAGVGSCDQFLMELSLRDCSVYTQRAYAIGLAHFFSWLHAAGGDPDHVTRQIVGSYITAFARSARQGAVGARGTQKPRQPRTINHRLSVLASYFDYCIRRDTEDGRGPWKGRINPASGNPLTEELRHGMIGRDLPARQRQHDGFRRRIPRTLPKILEPAAIQKLIDSAGSCRDKAILILLSRAGQRIGDWSPVAGRHGILGMELEDIDRKRRFITVRLKGRAISTAYPSPTISGRFMKSTCAPNAARRRTFMPFGSRRGKVEASLFAMRVLNLLYATSGDGQASRFIRTCSATPSRKAYSTPPATSRSRRRFSAIHT